MDASRFDRLSRVLATAPTRRTALAGLAVLLGRPLLAPGPTAARSRICRPLGTPCFPERGLACCRGECRSGRCRCPQGQHRCGTRCLRQGRRCRPRHPRRGCRPTQQRCQGRCIAKAACCGGCPEGQVCRNGGYCDVTTTAELQAALADGGPDTIRLCPKTTYRGTFTITRPVTVIGAGATSSFLDGASNGPVVFILSAFSGGVHLQELGIVNGVSPMEGGGLLAFDSLTLTRCRVANNEANANGGGIATTSSLTLVDTVVAGNRTTFAGNGIAISGLGASLTLFGSSRVEHNKAINDIVDIVSEGGGIHAQSAAEVTLRDRSQVRRNEAWEGGGVYISSSSTVDLRGDSQVEANTARFRGGGVFVRSSARLEMHDRSLITGNQARTGVSSSGGGIFRQEFDSVVTLPDQAMVRGNTPDQCEPSQPTGDGGTCD